MIRSIIVLLLFILFFIGFFPVQLLLFLLRQFNPELERRITLAIIRTFLSVELVASGTTVEASGLENIPEDEAVLFIGNHRSDFDVLCTYKYMKRPTGYVSKKELRKIPIMAQWMELLECTFIDRSNIRQGLKAIQDCIGKIQDGVSVFIFPEGTRNKNEDHDIPMEFKEGSLKIAQRSGCRIIPVAIQDTEKIFEDHVPYIRRQRVRVRFCKPLLITDIPAEYKKTPAAYVRQIIADELQNMRNVTKNSYKR